MSGGLGDNTNRIPVVATPASAAPDKAWIPLEVLEVVWDFMSEKSELSKAGCDLLSKLVTSAGVAANPGYSLVILHCGCQGQRQEQGS